MAAPGGAPAGGRDGDFVRSLERGLAVIRAFDAEDRELTLSGVARKAGLTRAAARRFLHTLAELGYVRGDGRLFALRPAVLELGYAYLSGLALPEVAQPHLEALTRAVGESSSISVLDGDMVVYVARVPVRRIMTVAITVGTRFPAHATSMGRVLLAHAEPDWLREYLARVELRPSTGRTVTSRRRLAGILAGVRRDGYALVDRELEEGLRSVAVPLRDPSGAVIAAMNVATHAGPAPADQLRADLLGPLQRAAAAIEADLRAHR